jgi:hypothetical protein
VGQELNTVPRSFDSFLQVRSAAHSVWIAVSMHEIFVYARCFSLVNEATLPAHESWLYYGPVRRHAAFLRFNRS